MMADKPKTPPQAQRFFVHDEPRHEVASAFAIAYMGVAYESPSIYFAPHRHDQHELIFIDRGLYHGFVNEEEVEVKPNQLLVVGPGDLHSDWCEEGLAYYAVRLRLRAKTAGRGQLHMLCDGLSPDERIFDVSDESFDRVRALMEQGRRASRFSLALQQAMAEELFWRLAEELPRERLNPALLEHSRETRLRVRLDQLFGEALQTPLTVKQMAERLGMSESAFAHACTELLGISPAKALTRYRLDRAAQLLRYSDLTASEIGALVGYPDPSHFSTAFRKQSGLTPGHYRQQYRP